MGSALPTALELADFLEQVGDLIEHATQYAADRDIGNRSNR
jgi:hypothetical protein